jgi:TAG lipase/lysophosphatidylethanolamine acyltransferase
VHFTGLLRNLGGMVDVKLFSRSPLGTKHLVEDYIEEVVRQLEIIYNSNDPAVWTEHSKVELFADTRQSFGNSALLLHGGATFGLLMLIYVSYINHIHDISHIGMYHLGVVKSLNEHLLLPRIISGTSVGALIAALVCVHTDEELPGIFAADGIDLRAFARKGRIGSVKRKILRLLKQGYLMDVTVLEDCVKANVGDITFEVFCS